MSITGNDFAYERPYGIMWRQLTMLQTGELCFCHAVGRGARDAAELHTMQNTACPKNYPVKNTASVKVKKLWFR